MKNNPIQDILSSIGISFPGNDLMQKLLDMGISSRRGIMTTHRETAYKEESKYVHLPVSEQAADNSIIIPLYVPMTEEEINEVIHCFREILTTK